MPAAKRPTSMVFQRLALFPHMTVAENIGFPLKLRKVAAEKIASRVDEMIALMQLKPEYLSRYPRELSGGEQQRVALARSMVSSPEAAAARRTALGTRRQAEEGAPGRAQAPAPLASASLSYTSRTISKRR